MNIFRGLRAAAYTACLALAAPVAMACPANLPPVLGASLVGEDVLINGLRMSITHVKTRDSIAAVFEQTEALWRKDGHEVRRGKSAGWQVLSVMGEKCFVSLQLADTSGTFGYFARSRKDMLAGPRLLRRAPRPPGATITSSVASNDDGRAGLVVTMSSPSSPQEINQYFIDTLMRERWSTPRSHSINNKVRGTSAVFLSAQRKREQIEIVIWPERGSQIVMTISEAL